MTNASSPHVSFLNLTNGYGSSEDLLEKCVAVIGYSLSIMAISIHVFVHFTTDLFQNFPGNLLISNCALLFLQYVSSMIFLMLEKGISNPIWNRDWLDIYNNSITIYIWSVLTRIQFAMAWDLWKCLRTKTTNIRLTGHHTIKFVKYMVCCWFSPFFEWGLLWLIASVFFKRLCFSVQTHYWLCPQNKLWFVFMAYYVSDFTVMISNIALYLLCLYYIYRTKSSVKNALRQKSNFIFYTKICGRLFIMSEVNYTLLIFVNHFQYTALKYVFYCCMAYHGTVVFSAIILKKSLLKYKSAAAVKTDSENTAMINITTTGSIR